MTTNVATVSKFLGSLIDLIRGIVPIVQSAQRKVGSSKSHEFVKQRYNQWSCRYGELRVTAGLSWLQCGE